MKTKQILALCALAIIGLCIGAWLSKTLKEEQDTKRLLRRGDKTVAYIIERGTHYAP